MYRYILAVTLVMFGLLGCDPKPITTEGATVAGATAPDAATKPDAGAAPVAEAKDAAKDAAPLEVKKDTP